MGNTPGEIDDGTRPRDVDQEQILYFGLKSLGLTLLRLDAVDIRREPKLSSAREIWSYRTFDVPPRDRMRILSALSEYGPRPMTSLDDIVQRRILFEQALRDRRQRKRQHPLTMNQHLRMMKLTETREIMPNVHPDN